MKLHLPYQLKAALLACFASSLPVCATEGAGTMHLYILTGQSNSLGSVKGSPASPGLLGQYASEGLLYNGSMAKDTGTTHDPTPAWATVAPHLPAYNGNNCMGPEYGFSYMMLHKGWVSSAQGDGLGVIKASLDGGGNSYWQRGTNAYNSILASTKAAIDAMKESGSYSSVCLDGLLYLQGESDSGADITNAQTRYESFISNLKSDLAAAGYDSSLLDSSVLGEPATWNGRDTAYNGTTTVAELKKLADRDESIGWVRTRDLGKIASGDSMGVHYDGKSEITIGARYAYAMAAQKGWETGQVRNDNYDASVSLNSAEAWWNGSAPTADSVLRWDVSSANVEDTISADLAVNGLVVEDPYRGGAAIANAAGGNSTLSVGAGGIRLLQGNLEIKTNLSTTADQEWRIAGGQTLAIGSESASVTLGGPGAVSLAQEGTGTASVFLYASGDSPARTWNVGDKTDVFLSSSRDTLNVAEGATVGLGSTSGSALQLETLTLGNGSTLNIGGADSVGGLAVGSISLGSGATLGMDIKTNSGYDTLSYGSLTAEDGTVAFKFSYGRGLTANRIYTIVQGWDASLSFTFNADAGYGRTASLQAVDGNLVLSIVGETANYEKTWVPAQGETKAISSSDLISGHTYNATAGGLESAVAEGRPATGNLYFYANCDSNRTGDAYGELKNTSATWVAGFGSGSGSNIHTLTGSASAKVSGADHVDISEVYGAVNATVLKQTDAGGNALEGSGSIYVQLDNQQASYGSVNGVYNSNVAGAATIVINGGAVAGGVTAGFSGGNAGKSIGEGTWLQINDGTFSGIVQGGSSDANATTINGGTHVLLNGGDYNNIVYAGSTGAGSTVNGGASLQINGGTFNNMVAGGNNGGAVINGNIELAINGGVFKNYVLGGGFSGTINGDVNFVISGGDFSAMNTTAGIYAGGGSGGTHIKGGTTVTLLGIDDNNEFSRYSGILSGGKQEANGELAGAKELVLSSYTATGVNCQLRDFDTLTATAGANTTLSAAATIGGASRINVNEASSLALHAEGGSGWDLSAASADIEAGSMLAKTGSGQISLHALAGAGAADVQSGTLALGSTEDFTGSVRIAGQAAATIAASGSGASYIVEENGTARIAAANANLGTLSGAGSVELTGSGGGAATAFTMAENWTGTVKFNAGRTNMANLDLSHYGQAGSVILFQGAGALQGVGATSANYSYIAAGSTVAADIRLEGDANGVGLNLNAGSSSDSGTITFSGAWSGNGDLVLARADTVDVQQHMKFLGDMTGFSGDISSNCGLVLKFGNGEATGISVGSVTGTGAIRGTGGGSDRTVQVHINYNDSTNSETLFTGNVSLSKEGGAFLNLLADNSYTGETHLEGGVIALKGEGSLGTGNVTISSSANSLKLGDSVSISAGSADGTISGHSKIAAAGIAGSAVRQAMLENLRMEISESVEEAVMVQYATFCGTSLLAGQNAKMNLSHVTFDAMSSAMRAESGVPCSIISADTTIKLGSANLASLMTLAEDGTPVTELDFRTDRYNALTLTGDLFLDDEEGLFARLTETYPSLQRVTITFDGADLSGVTRIVPDEEFLPPFNSSVINGNAIQFTASLPEPSSAALALLALGALAAWRRRR